MNGEKFLFPIGIAKTEGKNKEIFKKNQTDLLQHDFKTHRCMILKLEIDVWSISGTYIYRHHVEPRVKL